MEAQSMASQEARERLDAALADLETSEGWARYLETRAKFHRYSFGNVMLIAFQRPEASRVAGYKAWQALGRQVRKGEKGIRILAPMIRKDKETGDSECFGFKCVSVFDVAQTDGEPLPGACRLLSEGGDQADYMALQDHAEAEGLTVEVEECAPANGFIDREGRRIVIGTHCFETGSPAQRIKTLAHELAHWHDLGPDQDPAAYRRDDAEIVAESVAFIVGQAIGLDTSDYSAGYVLSWAGGDRQKLKGLAERIDQAAHPLLTMFEREAVAA